MNAHQIKCLKEFFEDTQKKRKKFTIRKDDRDPRYEVGDVLIIKEVVKEGLTGEVVETGRACSATIEYVLRGFEGLAPGYCAIGFKRT